MPSDCVMLMVIFQDIFADLLHRQENYTQMYSPCNQSRLLVSLGNSDTSKDQVWLLTKEIDMDINIATLELGSHVVLD